MPVYGTYASLTDIRAALDYPASDTSDDTRLRQVLENVSRWIDEWCSRHFYVKVQTRYYTAQHHDALLVDDLLSVTTLKTDSDGDRTYDETWATTDYDLVPYNEFPKYAIEVTPDGDYSFPGYRRGVEIAGLWGFGDGDSATPYTDSTTDTAEELDASETAVDVASGAALAVGQTILVESEQMYITGISTNTLTVIRGVNGTTAATHATAKDVYIYRYPGPVVEACLIQTARIFKRSDAPFGVSGSGEFGQATVLSRLDPDVRKMLDPFRNLGAA